MKHGKNYREAAAAVDRTKLYEAEEAIALVKQVAKGETIPRITYNFETVFTEDDNFSKYDPRGY